MRTFGSIVIIFALAVTGWAQGPIVTKDRLDLDAIRPLPVLEGQRKKPLDSLARETVRRVTLKEVFEKTDPTLLFLYWTFEPEKARKDRVLALPPAGVSQEIGFDLTARVADPNIPNALARWVSYDEVLANETFAERRQALSLRDPDTFSKAEAELVQFIHRVLTFADVSGLDENWKAIVPEDRGAIPCLPSPRSVDELGSAYRWRNPAHIGQLLEGERRVAAGENIGSTLLQLRQSVGYPKDALAPILAHFHELRSAFVGNDGTAFSTAAAGLIRGLRELGAPNYPNATDLAREVRYNVTHPFQWAQWAYVLAFVLSFFALIFRAKLPFLVAFVPLLGGIGIHAWGIVQRSALSQAMIGNYFESLLFVALVCAVVGGGFGLFYQQRAFVFAGSALAWPTLIAALDSPTSWETKVGTLQPVLINNYWIHIHVPTIVSSYVFLGVAVVLAHVFLIWWAISPKSAPLEGLAHGIKAVSPWGVALLFVGMVLGGLWADVSWGRFWGFDPKETWSLITFLVFIAVIHGQWTGWLRGVGTAVGTVIGGWSLLWTYWGANFIQKGLHSYADAASGGVIPTWFWIFAGAQLTLLGITATLRLIRDDPQG